MRLLILGGTGPSGILLLREALAANHTLVVYARSPHKLPPDLHSHPSITVITGQLTDVDNLTEAVKGVDAVLSFLGPPSRSLTSHPRSTPIAHAYTALIEAMKKHGVKRLIAMGTPSIVDASDKYNFKLRLIVNIVYWIAYGAYKDILALAEVIRKEGEDLDWTIVRVPLLTNGTGQGVIVGYIGDGKTGATLTRAGFATFVLQELDQGDWIHKSPIISSA